MRKAIKLWFLHRYGYRMRARELYGIFGLLIIAALTTAWLADNALWGVAIWIIALLVITAFPAIVRYVPFDELDEHAHTAYMEEQRGAIEAECAPESHKKS